MLSFIYEPYFISKVSKSLACTKFRNTFIIIRIQNRLYHFLKLYKWEFSRIIKTIAYIRMDQMKTILYRSILLQYFVLVSKRLLRLIRQFEKRLEPQVHGAGPRA